MSLRHQYSQKQKTNMNFIFAALLLVNYVMNQGILNMNYFSFEHQNIYSIFILEVQVIPSDQIETDYVKGTYT